MNSRNKFVTAAELVAALQKCNPLDRVMLSPDPEGDRINPLVIGEKGLKSDGGHVILPCSYGEESVTISPREWSEYQHLKRTTPGGASR